MSADKADVVVARPRRVFVGAIAATGALLSGSLYAWFAMPAEIRQQFNIAEVGTLALILAILIFLVWLIGASSVRADAQGIRFRNGLRVHRFAWSEVAGFQLRESDPWVRIVLYATIQDGAEAGEHITLGIVGLQPSDGPRAMAAIDHIRELLMESWT